ncbi:hypothetical protein [Salinimicrobium oceani]|uniref:Anti-sigma-K factor rskA n=1 Tax=Salinimicrobium oceani TaxID=2722702 RepID=A0ABX1CTL4_9FLAO|nr:hypothetical protein [Salinimicrobium oceani]NJW51620.1 hypothetical protein [Salinimicrobium oceani]
MKKDNPSKNALSLQNSFKILSYIFAAILISACSKQVTFPVSEIVPAAEAVVKVEKDSNKNFDVALEVTNLAPPNRLTPARNHYVVWLVTKKHGTINIGNLNINRKNSGKLSTSTPYEPIRVFITAEDDSKPVLPSTQVVLNSGDFKV